ncbi:MAG: hypothetical protein PVF75_00890 [Granulosicoccaceae bacterium]|jgi:hypothetical protein
MKSVLHIIARMLLLLSLAVAPLYGVTAPLMAVDTGGADSQIDVAANGQDMQKHDHGCCDMTGMDGCNGTADCNASCSTCGHCNVAAALVAVSFNNKPNPPWLVAVSDTRLGIVLPIEIRPPQVF